MPTLRRRRHTPGPAGACSAGLALATLVPALLRRPPPNPRRARVARIGRPQATEMTADMVGPQALGPQVNMFLRGLRELGYVYGEHFVTEPRGAEGKPERVPSLAAELVRLQVDVIVAAGPALPALKQATSIIPIVMGAPVTRWARGLVRVSDSLVELPTVESSVGRDDRKATRVAQGAHSGRGARGGPLDSASHRGLAGGRNSPPQARRWRLLSLEVRDVGEIEGAVRRRLARGPVRLLVLGAGVFLPHARRIAELAAGAGSPAIVCASALC